LEQQNENNSKANTTYELNKVEIVEEAKLEEIKKENKYLTNICKNFFFLE
jgi:hypothetical protein